MRRVDDPAEFADALASAAREAEASFGDGSCLIEKYLTRPRHIEIQVFGDQQGNAVHLFERDCSLQRRHQKVIEEAPAPGMPEAMRHAMGEAAVRAAKAIGYVNAGTIEFIADVSDGLRADRFYFMEMNTRLQVEHPVTELITGQDLVEWQLRVAAGEPLPMTQDDLAINGWAFEARLYAEDVPKGFLPATGRLDHLAFPENDARIDKGVRAGDAITPFYDPMIAKLIVHGKDRHQALDRLNRALAATRIAGTVTNLRFLHNLSQHKPVAAGDVDTGLIERDIDSLADEGTPPDHALALAALAALDLPRTTNDNGVEPWDRRDGWRLWGKAETTALLARNDTVAEITISIEGPACYHVTTPDHTLNLTRVTRTGNEIQCLADGIKGNASVLRNADVVTVFIDGQSFQWTIPDQLQSGGDQEESGDSLNAPMPGLIKLVHVENGQAVTKDMPLLVMEAMKMEHTLRAPRDGTIEHCLVTEGDQVEEGTLLLQLVV